MKRFLFLVLILLLILPVSADTITLYSNTSGILQRYTNASWPVIRNADGQYTTSAGISIYTTTQSTSVDAGIYDYHHRAAVTIPINSTAMSYLSGATVTGVTFTVYSGASKYQGLGTVNLSLIYFSPSNKYTYAAGDYDATNFTRLSTDIPYASFAANNGSNEYILNDFGKGVVTTAISGDHAIAFMIDHSASVDNTSLIWTNQTISGFLLRGDKFASGMYAPRVTITYTPKATFSQNVSSDNNIPNLAVQFNTTSHEDATAWNWSFTDYGNATLILTPFSTEKNATQLFGAGNFSVNHTASVGDITYLSDSQWINISAGRFRQGLEEQNLTGFQYFPDDHIYNTDISGLPISVNSTLYIGNMSMGPPTSAYLYVTAEVPVIQVDANITKTAPISVTSPAGSNGTVFPIPDYTDISVPGAVDDHWVRYVDRDANTVYAMFGSGSAGRLIRYPNGTYHVYSTFQATGSSYDIPSNMRNDPPVVRYDEIATGNLTHPIGIAVNTSKNFGNIWPIRYSNGANTSQWAPPKGTILRLRQNFTVHNYTLLQRNFLNGLKNYGMVIIDNTGAQSTYWFGGKVLEDNATLKTEFQGSGIFNGGNASNPDHVHASDFEIVNQTSLMISEDSGQAAEYEPEPDPETSNIVILIINYVWQFFHIGRWLL